MKQERVKGSVSRGDERRSRERDTEIKIDREIPLGAAPCLMNKMLSLILPT